jgi:phytol kinase
MLELGIIIGYYIVIVALPPVLLKAYTPLPFELIRKIHHIAYAMSIFLRLTLFSTWVAALLPSFVLVLIAYPFLWTVERFPFYRRFFVEREGSKGGLRRQLLYIEATFAILIIFFWGLLGDEWRYIAAVAIMAWGFGDAAAALIGKRFGRRRIQHPLVDEKKTVEGTQAMFIMAGLAIFFTLLLYAGYPWDVSFAVALLVAPVCAIVELISRRGTDTLTVPLSAGLSVLSLMALFSALGV